MNPFAPFQLSLDRRSDEIRPIFPVLTDGVDPVESSRWEGGLHPLRPKFFSSHVYFSPYALLTGHKSYGILGSQSREADMAHFLTTKDTNALFAACVFGAGPKVVSKVPMIRRQGNGNLTGFVRTTYSDGSTTDHEFVVNAATREDVAASYSKAEA